MCTHLYIHIVLEICMWVLRKGLKRYVYITNPWVAAAGFATILVSERKDIRDQDDHGTLVRHYTLRTALICSHERHYTNYRYEDLYYVKCITSLVLLKIRLRFWLNTWPATKKPRCRWWSLTKTLCGIFYLHMYHRSFFLSHYKISNQLNFFFFNNFAAM